MAADPDHKLDIPPEWEAAAGEIFERRLRIVLMVGGAGVGKSSFSRYLTAELLARQAEVAFVDADIGQSNLGPPAAVTLGYPAFPVNFAASTPAAFYFVGSTSPVGRFMPLIIGTARLAREAKGEFVIIDTTGLVHGPGRILKSYKIDAVQPDVVIAIERRRELAPICTANQHVPLNRIKPSPKAHAKDDYEKIEVRRRSYARHFAGARLLEFQLDKLVFQRTLLFTGQPIKVEGAAHAERSAEGILIVGAPDTPLADSKLLPLGFERNLLCGVADAHGQCLGLGIIDHIDFAAGTISVTTSVEREKVQILQFGDVYVTAEGDELGQVKWGW